MQESHLERAARAIGQSNWTVAWEAIDAALLMDDKNALAFALKAFVFYSLDEPEKAAPFAAHAIALQPDLAMGHRVLALACGALGESRDAERHSDEALRLQPTPANWHLHGTILSRQARWADVLDAAARR